MTIWWNPPYQPPYYPPYQPHVTTGWSCPRCGRVWAPHVSSCTCGSGTTYYNTWGTGTTDSTLITNFNIHIPDPDDYYSGTYTFPDPPDPDEDEDDDGPEGCPV